jgi:hypothetical protein
MQSTNVRQIKTALVEQAFLGSTRVSCPLGPIVAVRRRKGQLLVMIRGWGRWYPVESVSIERMCVARTVEDRAEGSIVEKTNETRITSVEMALVRCR